MEKKLVLLTTQRYEPFFQWLISTVIARFNGQMKDKMTGKELNEMMASGAIKIIKGRLVSTENEKMDYGQ